VAAEERARRGARGGSAFGRGAWSRGYGASLARIRASKRTPLLQVVKTSIATVIAWLLCDLLLHQSLPIFAAIAALLVVQPSVNQTLSKGIERSVGVIGGVVLAYLAGLVFGDASWVVLGAVVVALLLSWAFRLSQGSANQIPISAMLVLAIGANTPDYALNRIIETIIGAAVGLLVNVAIVPPVLLGPAHRAVARLAASTSTVMNDIADALIEPRTGYQLTELLLEARLLREMRDAAEDALVSGEESLALNPRRSRHRDVLERDRELLQRLNTLVTRVIGIARAVHDNYDPGIAADPVVRSIATELRRASHDLELLARTSRTPGADGPPEAAEEPALTAPLTIAKPHPTHWILIGSLMEDIRRIREEIIGD